MLLICTSESTINQFGTEIPQIFWSTKQNILGFIKGLNPASFSFNLPLMPYGAIHKLCNKLKGEGGSKCVTKGNGGGGGLTVVLCNTKVYILLTLYMSPISPVFCTVESVVRFSTLNPY